MKLVKISLQAKHKAPQQGFPRNDEGYKLRRKFDGEWVWTEGVRSYYPVLAQQEQDNIDACCKRRKIKGEFYLREPITIDGVTFA